MVRRKRFEATPRVATTCMQLSRPLVDHWFTTVLPDGTFNLPGTYAIYPCKVLALFFSRVSYRGTVYPSTQPCGWLWGLGREVIKSRIEAQDGKTKEYTGAARGSRSWNQFEDGGVAMCSPFPGPAVLSQLVIFSQQLVPQKWMDPEPASVAHVPRAGIAYCI